MAPAIVLGNSRNADAMIRIHFHQIRSNLRTSFALEQKVTENDHFRFLDAPLHYFQKQPVIKQAPYRPHFANGRPRAFHFCRVQVSRNVSIKKTINRIEPLPSPRLNDRGWRRGSNKRHREERPL